MAGKPKHGDSTEGRGKRIYNIWRGIRQRCSNPKATNYADYGGRGISVCSQWEDYFVFRSWALLTGYAINLSIERQDVNGNYTPNNCYWANTTIQACNKRKRLGKRSLFIGVAPNKANWQAYVNYEGTRKNLGTFSTDLAAALARDAYIKANNLPHKLNF